ncbi:hypothetical protein BDU57DRAFT_143804 [Ampelomyces quisqualis]|uniref:Glycosyltransferase 2 n=1 Tax=Ampelomyces quisqualis TaxID=50730 RepID=A0A6A5QXY5_AMPQU|nr:hypothetical protein BDU57DRAFT_143804 [Ampelomyces quisqualis]
MQARGTTANPGWLQEGMIRGHMLGKAMLPGDEELGKKDDDFKLAPARRSGWSIWNHTFRWRRRRILLVVAGLGLVWLVLKMLGAPGDGSRYAVGRPNVPGDHVAHDFNDGYEARGAPTGMQLVGSKRPRTFDGRIRFYHLTKSLRQSATYTNGYDDTNRNVLFAMSSLSSAATLLPMVCEMAMWNRNYVHAAIMGREDIPLDELLEINGVNKGSCPAIWHDARPDYSEYSSDDRAQSAVMGALSSFQSMLHPQAVIMDDSLSEDAFFVKGVRSTTEKLGIALIEVPKGKWENFLWITRLDAGSLRSWHVPTVDLLIQVPPESSSVLRLLESIKHADYAGLKPPRILLELPSQLDESVQRRLENFKWPLHPANPLEPSGLIIRRRISTHRVTQKDAAIRFLELFWPASTTKMHVLLLSPQAQLSPLYYHFVKYSLLEYKFSTFGQQNNWNLLGVSLNLPSALLDGKTRLTPPSLGDMNTNRYEKLFPTTASAPFLWQAPNSHATLFFGDKWVELHSFLSNRIAKHQESQKAASRAKLVSETLPAWTEYMLEFMRARAYTILYPAKTAGALVTIHNELYHAPEEFGSKDGQVEGEVKADLDEPFSRAETPANPPNNAEPPTIPGSKPLHLALPFDGDLPEVAHLPHLLYDGTMIPSANISRTARDYADGFRREIGGCPIPEGKQRKILLGEARDLFCFGDEDASDWEDDVRQDTYQATVIDKLLVDGDGDGYADGDEE